MSDKTDWPLLARYLSENASSLDERAVLDWALHPENKARLDEATSVWKHSGTKIELPPIESEQDWAELLRRIDDQPDNLAGTSRRKRLIWIAVLGIALMGTGLIYYVIYGGDSGVQKQRFGIVSTKDSVIQYFLPDGTLVWVGPDTQIQFNKPYVGHIWLTGEAFFQLKDSTKRLRIDAQGSVTTARASSFNIRARPRVPVEVSVVTGSVTLNRSGGNADAKIKLIEGERGVYQPKEGSITKTRVDDAFLEWRKVNSAVYALERKGPERFLDNKWEVRSKGSGQVIVKGTLVNMASLASFSKIQLKIVLSAPRGRSWESTLHIPPDLILAPGHSIAYQTTMAGTFNDKCRVYFQVEHIEVK